MSSHLADLWSDSGCVSEMIRWSLKTLSDKHILHGALLSADGIIWVSSINYFIKLSECYANSSFCCGCIHLYMLCLPCPQIFVLVNSNIQVRTTEAHRVTLLFVKIKFSTLLRNTFVLLSWGTVLLFKLFFFLILTYWKFCFLQ